MGFSFVNISRRIPKWVLPLLSGLLTVLALGFVGQRVWQDRAELVAALGGLRVAPGLAAVVLAAVGMTWTAVMWKRLLDVMGAAFSYRQALSSFYLGELGKYIPGGLWPILGRGELARKAGVPRSVAYPSVLMSLGLVYIAAAIFAAVSIPVVGLVPRTTALGYVGIVGCALGGVLLLSPQLLQQVRRRIPLSKLDKIPNLALPVSLRLLALYTPTWLAIGFSTSLLALAVRDDVNLFQVAVAAVVSWLVGFLVFPVPGGLGIRESVLILLAGLGEVDGLTVALLSRSLFVLVDVVGFLVALVVQRLEVSE